MTDGTRHPNDHHREEENEGEMGEDGNSSSSSSGNSSSASSFVLINGEELTRLEMRYKARKYSAVNQLSRWSMFLIALTFGTGFTLVLSTVGVNWHSVTFDSGTITRSAGVYEMCVDTLFQSRCMSWGAAADANLLPFCSHSTVSEIQIAVPVVWTFLVIMYGCVSTAFGLALYVSFRPTNHPLYVVVAALQGVALCCGIVLLVVMQKVVLGCLRGTCAVRDASSPSSTAAPATNTDPNCVETRGWAYSAAIAAVVGSAVCTVLALYIRVLVARMRYAAQEAHKQDVKRRRRFQKAVVRFAHESLVEQERELREIEEEEEAEEGGEVSGGTTRQGRSRSGSRLVSSSSSHHRVSHEPFAEEGDGAEHNKQSLGKSEEGRRIKGGSGPTVNPRGDSQESASSTKPLDQPNRRAQGGAAGGGGGPRPISPLNGSFGSLHSLHSDQSSSSTNAVGVGGRGGGGPRLLVPPSSSSAAAAAAAEATPLSRNETEPYFVDTASASSTAARGGNAPPAPRDTRMDSVVVPTSSPALGPTGGGTPTPTASSTTTTTKVFRYRDKDGNIVEGGPRPRGGGGGGPAASTPPAVSPVLVPATSGPPPPALEGSTGQATATTMTTRQRSLTTHRTASTATSSTTATHRMRSSTVLDASAASHSRRSTAHHLDLSQCISAGGMLQMSQANLNLSNSTLQMSPPRGTARNHQPHHHHHHRYLSSREMGVEIPSSDGGSAEWVYDDSSDMFYSFEWDCFWDPLNKEFYSVSQERWADSLQELFGEEVHRLMMSGRLSAAHRR